MSTVKEQLPAFHYFQVGNGYSGNIGNRCYKIITDSSENKLAAHVYDGPLCFELIQERGGVLCSAQFELCEEGFEACKDWLEKNVQGAD